MARKLPQIPNPRTDVPKVIADIINPIREILQVRFLTNASSEKSVTRADLVKLGLVTDEQLNTLDD